MARRKGKEATKTPEETLDDVEPSPAKYSVRLLVEGTGNCPFLKWFEALRDAGAKGRILPRLSRIVRDGNLGDHRERIQGAISELRIDYGPGYRVYYVQVGSVILVLLGGGTKDSQQADIEAAVKLWEANKDEDDRFSRVFGA